MTTFTIEDAPYGPIHDEQLSNVIGSAFATLAVSEYLIPDATVRKQILTRHLGQQVPWARRYGRLLTDSGMGSASVWLRVSETGALAKIPNYEQNRTDFCGPHIGRVAEFESRLHQHHPVGRKHWYLALLAVRPELQGKGLGSAHLELQLAYLDQVGLPAYLEAADLESLKLYERFGFRGIGLFSCGIGGPCLYPMWREPAQ